MDRHFPPVDECQRDRLFVLPPGRVPVVIDTDAANEIDDQFALAWAALAPERIELLAVHAAPFSFAHRRAALGRELRDEAPFAPPQVGMRRSAAEARRVLALACRDDPPPVFEGADGYLPGRLAPRPSAASADLIERARSRSPGDPLVVLALGCPTNIASALLEAPDLVRRLLVVWTSGWPSHAPHRNDSFNLEQDLHASRVLLASGVPLVYLPGFQVGAQLRLSLPEVERWVAGRGALGNALHHLYTHNPLWELQGIDGFFAHSWVIWDLICVAWVLDAGWVPTLRVPTPGLDADRRWVRVDGAPTMLEGFAVRRDAIFADFFRRLDAAAQR